MENTTTHNIDETKKDYVEKKVDEKKKDEKKVDDKPIDKKPYDFMQGLMYQNVNFIV